MVSATPSEDKSTISLALFFVRLSLYAVNWKQVPDRHGDVYVWSAVFLLTYFSGVSEIKNNITTEDFPFLFLVLMR